MLKNLIQVLSKYSSIRLGNVVQELRIPIVQVVIINSKYTENRALVNYCIGGPNISQTDTASISNFGGGLLVSVGKVNILGALWRSKLNIFQQFKKKNREKQKMVTKNGNFHVPYELFLFSNFYENKYVKIAKICKFSEFDCLSPRCPVGGGKVPIYTLKLLSLSDYNVPLNPKDGIIFDSKLHWLPLLNCIRDSTSKKLNIIKIIAHTSWGGDSAPL
ncbi:hypothetical protein AGLY_004117 [Aphis glycines]|uniref:Uncharacterized protein n=1 Tax=Aphis glycines TaxID=307491 RepID=A0A6G0TX65_APHGL|nr:hypothetical protein AGLY_004117 [Aphis glycines]